LARTVVVTRAALSILRPPALSQLPGGDDVTLPFCEDAYSTQERVHAS
jgi:hypothetical protein